MREVLKPGTIIPMPNGAEYTIGEVIGEGGFSIVYRAHTVGGNTETVIKEFYPAPRNGYRLSALRDENGIVRAAEGFEERFDRLRARFDSEGEIGGRIAAESYQVIPFIASGNGYALMQRQSLDMTSIDALVASWSQRKPLPYSGKEEDSDPCFTGMTRTGYALRVIDSLLSAVASIHRRGFLHLDLSARNVLWAGADQQSGRNCTALLTDFGCAVPLTDGEYMPEQPLSFSPGFDAPEVQRGHEPLTPATDIYSVGVLLLYLCFGEQALDLHRSRLPANFIRRLLDDLSVPPTVRLELLSLIATATARLQASRFDSADAMQEHVRRVLAMLPAHPVNPDVSDAFTLYSLKSMMEGSEASHYSWADELCDRRGKMRSELPDNLRSALSYRPFDSDEDFLSALLPISAFSLIHDSLANRQIDSLQSVMTCNYPVVIKNAFCRKFQRIGMHELIQRCNTLLNEKEQFKTDSEALWMLLGEDGKQLHECVQRIDARRNQAAALALMTLYALVGKETFCSMTNSTAKLNALFSKSLMK